jgi:hypothetical protein
MEDVDGTKQVVVVDNLTWGVVVSRVQSLGEVQREPVWGKIVVLLVRNAVQVHVALESDVVVVVRVVTISLAEVLTVTEWKDIQINWMVLELLSVHSLEGSCVLEGNDVTLSKVNVEFTDLSWKGDVLTLSNFCTTSGASDVEDIAPDSLREEEVSSAYKFVYWLNRKLEWLSKHDIKLGCFISTLLKWEWEEQGLVESSSVEVEHGHLSGVVANQAHFSEHCFADLKHALDREGPWSLVNVSVVVVVSREGLEGSDCVPSCAELSCCVTVEAADVSAWQWETCDVLGHNSGDRQTHVLCSAEVVTEPSRTKLAHASVSRSCDDHGSLLDLFEPLVSGLNLHSSVEVMSIKLNCTVVVLCIQRNCFQREISACRVIVELILDRFEASLIFVAYSVAEVFRLIHIQ